MQETKDGFEFLHSRYVSRCKTSFYADRTRNDFVCTDDPLAPVLVVRCTGSPRPASPAIIRRNELNAMDPNPHSPPNTHSPLLFFDITNPSPNPDIRTRSTRSPATELRINDVRADLRFMSRQKGLDGREGWRGGAWWRGYMRRVELVCEAVVDR